MKFEDVLGQAPAIGFLRKALAAGRLPHALLFQGPESVGKGTVARILAGALLCESGGERPCDRCSACVKRSHGNHPDLLLIERLPKKRLASEATDPVEGEEDEEPGGRGDLRPFIVVAQVRDACGHAAYAPREGGCRVFVLDPADRMNVEAQNALLKTLEEPPGHSILILVASRPHVLLPTVRSRCLSIRFGPLPVDTLAAALRSRGFSAEEALARAALAGGRPGRALSLDPTVLRGRRDAVLEIVENLAGRPAALAGLAAMVSTLGGSDEDELLEGLEILEGVLRDAAVSAAGVPDERLVYRDVAARLEDLGRRLGRSRAASLVRMVESVRGDLRFHVNRTLLAEAVLAAVAGGPLA